MTQQPLTQANGLPFIFQIFPLLGDTLSLRGGRGSKNWGAGGGHNLATVPLRKIAGLPPRQFPPRSLSLRVLSWSEDGWSAIFCFFLAH